MDHYTIAPAYVHKNVTIDPQVKKSVITYFTAVLQEKCTLYNELYGFVYNNITLRSQKTRWGSCSSRGNLSFNIKMVSLPERLQKYIIVHELCHLEQMNHSQDFWSLVAREVPEYKSYRAELKNYTL